MPFIPFGNLSFDVPPELELASPVWAGRGYSIALLAELLSGGLLIWRLWAIPSAPRRIRLIVCIAVVVGLPVLNLLLNLLRLAVYAEHARGTGAPFW